LLEVKADKKQTASALYVVDVYGPLNGASAIGANGLARYAFAAAFPLFTAQSGSFLFLFFKNTLDVQVCS
jgi:hypothetical protein